MALYVSREATLEFESIVYDAKVALVRDGNLFSRLRWERASAESLSSM